MESSKPLLNSQSPLKASDPPNFLSTLEPLLTSNSLPPLFHIGVGKFRGDMEEDEDQKSSLSSSTLSISPQNTPILRHKSPHLDADAETPPEDSDHPSQTSSSSSPSTSDDSKKHLRRRSLSVMDLPSMIDDGDSSVEPLFGEVRENGSHSRVDVEIVSSEQISPSKSSRSFASVSFQQEPIKPFVIEDSIPSPSPSPSSPPPSTSPSSPPSPTPSIIVTTTAAPSPKTKEKKKDGASLFSRLLFGKEKLSSPPPHQVLLSTQQDRVSHSPSKRSRHSHHPIQQSEPAKTIEIPVGSQADASMNGDSKSTAAKRLFTKRHKSYDFSKFSNLSPGSDQHNTNSHQNEKSQGPNSPSLSNNLRSISASTSKKSGGASVSKKHGRVLSLLPPTRKVISAYEASLIAGDDFINLLANYIFSLVVITPISNLDDSSSLTNSLVPSISSSSSSSSKSNNEGEGILGRLFGSTNHSSTPDTVEAEALWCVLSAIARFRLSPLRLGLIHLQFNSEKWKEFLNTHFLLSSHSQTEDQLSSNHFPIAPPLPSLLINKPTHHFIRKFHLLPQDGKLFFVNSSHLSHLYFRSHLQRIERGH